MRAAFWAILAVLAIAIVVSMVSLFGGSRPIGSENRVGNKLPDFAVPLVGGGVSGDANLFTPAAARDSGSKAACEVKLKGTMNSCDGLGGAAVLVFWNSGKEACLRQVDQLQTALAQRPRVNALALSFDESIADATTAAEQAGWKMPVGIDRDGAVAGYYGVMGCPTIFYAKDGVVQAVRLGIRDAKQLGEEIDRYSGANSAAK